jgi:hypothetical protein
MLTRIFNWLVGDAAVDGVDPALHRRALWVAFEVWLIAAAASYLLTWPGTMMLIFNFNVPYGLLRALSFIPSVPYVGVTAAVLVPLLVYTLVLRLNGVTLPAPIVILASALLTGLAVENWSGPYFFFSFSGSIALVVIVLLDLGLLRRRASAIALAVAMLFAVTDDFWLANYFRLSAAGTEIPMGIADHYAGFSVLTANPLWFAIAIILPLSLLSSPRPRLPRPSFVFKLDFAWLMLGLILLLSLAFALGHRYLLPLVPSNIRTGLTLVAVFSLWWALLRLGGESRLTQFLLLTFAGFVAIYNIIPSGLPALARWLCAALGAGILALWLAAPERIPRGNLGYFVMGLLDGAGAVVYYQYGIINLAKLHQSFNPAPVALTVKLGCAFALELALVLAAALFLWASVRPAEVRELLWPSRAGADNTERRNVV